MPDPITTLAVATGGAFLGKFVGPAAEHYGKLALERAQQLGTRATALLAQVGREPQSVEPKILIPLVQGAGLESDPTLADLWAALLANAADPTQQALVQPGFAEVLRQLTPTDAALVSKVAEASQGLPTKAKRVDTFYEVATLHPAAADDTAEVALDNVVRLGLCTTRGPVPILNLGQMLGGGGGIRLGEERPGRQRAAITYLGLAFLAAVTPPTP